MQSYPSSSSPKRAVIYARVSTRMQAHDGRSIDVQVSELTKNAHSKGWEVVEVYIDAGESGGNMDRPGLQRMLEDARSSRFDILQIYDFSRLSRDTANQLTLFQLLHDEGILVWSQVEGFVDYSSPSSKLVAQVMGAVNEHQRMITKKKLLNQRKIG